MNAPRLTDAQIARALHAHLPERAQAGLRERILETAQTTSQHRALPSFLGALSEADPVTRRRSLLVAAALLIALALASAVAVGALRLLERDPFQDLSLEPPTDLQAFVLSSYDRLPELPPLAMTWRDDGAAKGRIYVHRSGAVRFDRFASAEATEPSSYTIISGNRLSGLAIVGSDKVWVEPGDEAAIGDDPRVFLRTVLSPGPILFEGPGCEMERDPNEIGNGTAATGWRYVGVEYVAGRPAHHVACVGDLWLDIETRLILRIRGLLADDAGQPIAGQFRTIEVTEIAFGEQPAALFERPEGAARMTSEAYSAYLCTRDLPNEEVVGFGASDCATPPGPEATPRPEATPLPTSIPNASVRPSPSGPAGPLAWSEARLHEDWPAPVRLEPVGGAIVRPQVGPSYPDPSGDTGSAVYPWIDIRALHVIGAANPLIIALARNLPPAVDPTEQWIAYGVVVDTDRDGVADWRYGIDNLPVTATGERGHRAWRTDLHTGRTESGAGAPYDLDELTTYFDTFWPGVVYGRDGARLGFGGDTTGPDAVDALSGLRAPFYAWASVIENGRVVATDYAPDVGWLDPSAPAKP